MMSARRAQRRLPKYEVTTYDTELERLSQERNRAYEILSDIERCVRNLPEQYDPVSNHLLCILYGEDNA